MCCWTLVDDQKSKLVDDQHSILSQLLTWGCSVLLDWPKNPSKCMTWFSDPGTRSMNLKNWPCCARSCLTAAMWPASQPNSFFLLLHGWAWALTAPHWWEPQWGQCWSLGLRCENKSLWINMSSFKCWGHCDPSQFLQPCDSHSCRPKIRANKWFKHQIHIP